MMSPAAGQGSSRLCLFAVPYPSFKLYNFKSHSIEMLHVARDTNGSNNEVENAL
jgi:hypothetical protein